MNYIHFDSTYKHGFFSIYMKLKSSKFRSTWPLGCFHKLTEKYWKLLTWSDLSQWPWGVTIILPDLLETKTLPKQLNLKSLHLVIWKGKFFAAES